MTDRRFPGAPAGSHVSEEGWLIVGDEAWTEAEWRTFRTFDPGSRGRRYATEEERLEARRRARRESARRRRRGEPLRIRRRSAA